MEQKAKAVLIMAVTLGALVLAGFVGVSYKDDRGDDQVASHSPNDRANHHPRHLTN